MPFEDHDLNTHRDGNPATGKRVPLWLSAGVVLLVGLGLAAWLADSEKRRGELDAQRAFIDETQQVASDIQRQLNRCEQIIRAFQSIFMASERVTPGEYALAYENMNDESVRRVSLQALAYAERQPSQRGDRYITTMFAPQENNAEILGLDVVTQPNNMEAL